MNTKLQVWHIPQIPGRPFLVPVSSPLEAKKVMLLLAEYDTFQYENSIKPDYSFAQGLDEWLEDEQEWADWIDEDGFTIEEFDLINGSLVLITDERYIVDLRDAV